MKRLKINGKMHNVICQCDYSKDPYGRTTASAKGATVIPYDPTRRNTICAECDYISWYYPNGVRKMVKK